MSNSTAHPLEGAVRAALQPPALRPAFDAAVRQRLRAAARQPRTAPRWRLSRRLALAGLVAALVLAITLAIGPQRVLAQVLGWFGYVPGAGYVETEGGLRVLANPHTFTQDGISVSILDGLVDDKHTILTILFEGIRREQKPTSENEPGCWPSPIVRLPDGRGLEVIGGGGGGGPTWMRMELTYPALPLDVNEATLQIPCVPEVLPGLGPENMEMPLLFEPAPEGFMTLPVQPLDAPTEQAAAPHGFALSVDDYVELDDGYLIRGRLSWEESEFTAPEFWWIGLRLVDADDNEIPVEFEEFPNPPTDPDQHYLTWILRTNTKYITSPAQIVLDELSVRITQSQETAAEVAIDLGPNPTHGQTWQVDANIPLNDHSVRLDSLTFESRPDGTYSLMARILYDTAFITNTTLMDKDNRSRMFGMYGGQAETGVQELGIIYDYLPTGIHRFWVDNYFVRMEGPWAAALTLPPPSGEPPAGVACLMPEDWQRVVTAPSTALPAGIGGRLLLGGGEVIDFDGELYNQPIQGVWPALSSDGTQLAYVDDTGLHLMQLETGQRQRISQPGAYSPVWAPSGDRLAYIQSGQGIAVVNADGSGQARVPAADADMIGIAGWMPDGRKLVVASLAPEGSMLQAIDLDSGAVEDLFVIDNRKGGFAHLSPDGEHVLYSGAALFGQMYYGLYVSKLDGSQARLLAQTDDEVVFLTAGAWSPDGQWLLLNPNDPMEMTRTPQHPLLLNWETCEAILVPGVQGAVVGWAAEP
ncbi:MAG: hypothetical protein KIT70_03150 [Anaerolineales bacterium]|nr:MAG: hypothetical protein KIT70_03150 [Anaerolineales bacterium]